MNKTNIIQQPNKDDFADNSKSLRADAIQNREQILEAAKKIFAEKGLSIPIGEIAREAGVGIGTIYRNFPTKEALFEAVNVNIKKWFTAKAESLMNDTDPGKAFFDFFSLILEEGVTNRALKDAFKNGAFNTQAAVSGVFQDFRSAYANLLTRAQHAKAIREDIDVDDLTTLLFGLLLALDQQGDATDINRFPRLLSIAIEGLRYKDTLQ
jgi:AcrR family transcriptional regulator